MARGQYYIKDDTLYYDDGTGFKPKGNVKGLNDGSPVDVSLTSYLAGTPVDPNTLQPTGDKPSTIDQALQAGSGGIQESKETFKLIPTVNQSTPAENSLRYPGNITSSNTDYVTFKFYDYDPPFGKGENQPNFTGSTAYTFYNASGSSYDYTNKIPKTQAKGYKSIILYMPEDIQSQYGAKWGGAEFGTAAVAGMRGFGTSLPNPGSGIPGSAALGMAKSKFYDLVLKQINEFTGSNINLNQFLGGVSGTILNPNTELMYEGADMRTFSLSFKMTPRSNGEAGIIKEICNTFKKAMLPQIGGQAFGGQSVSLLKIPKLCQVMYMYGSSIHPYLPVYKLCGITSVDVNYTADGAYATYSGGSPVSTRLTVGFKETKILLSNDINTAGLSH